MDFIYIRHDGRYRYKGFLSAIPIPGPDLAVNVTDLECSYKSQIFTLQFIKLNYQDSLMNSKYIWHDDSARSPPRGLTLRSRSQT